MTVEHSEDAVPSPQALNDLFQSSGDCIKLLDLDGRLLLMNLGGASAMELLDPTQLVGQNWIEFWAAHEREAARAAVAAARQGDVGRCRGYLPTAKGTPKWWETVITPVKDSGGGIVNLLVVSRDVSEQHRLRQQLEASLRRTNAIITATSEIVWQIDPARMIGSTTGLAEFSGASDDCATREAWLSLIHPDDRKRIDVIARDNMEAGTEHVIEYRLRHRSGTYRWVEDRAVPISPDDVSHEWVGVIRDIDDRVKTAHALRDSEERLRLALQASRVGIWDVDLVAGIRRWSTDLKGLLGLSADAVESEDLLLSLVHPEDRPLVEEAHRVAFRDTPTVMFRVFRADTGEQRWILSSGQPVLDKAGRPVRRLGTFQDITERKLIEDQLWTAANQDPLTALSNRNLFNAQLELAVAAARATGTRVALMIVDLDRFKEVNDTLGHHAGDVVLRTTAQRLAAACHPAATAARLGGDEFAVLLPGAGSADEVAAAAEALLRELGRPIPYDHTALTCPASLGLAIYPDHDESPGELLKNADIALYAAKRSGRACFAAFDPSMKLAVQKRFAVLQRTRDALAQREIVPFYQPKVAVTGRTVCGFEALLRWRDGPVIRGPVALVEAFDDPEIAAQIGERMLDLVTADIVQWQRAGLDVGSVAVNVAAAEFCRIDVADRWLSTLEARGLPPGVLQMEITESVFLGEGSDAVGRALAAVHEHGVAIALDDFGTGYASLTHLRRYPVDWLKVDRSFIGDLADDSGAHAIVSAVINLAHGIGLRVVAEGVEEDQQVSILAQMGCDLAQGYRIARPMAASWVPHFMATWAGFADADAEPIMRYRRA